MNHIVLDGGKRGGPAEGKEDGAERKEKLLERMWPVSRKLFQVQTVDQHLRGYENNSHSRRKQCSNSH